MTTLDIVLCWFYFLLPAIAIFLAIRVITQRIDIHDLKAELRGARQEIGRLKEIKWRINS